MSNVLHDGTHCLDKQIVVFVVHGHDDEQFRLAAVDGGSKGVALLEKVVGVTGSGGVTHVFELALTLEVDVLKQLLWDWAVHDQVSICQGNVADRLLGEEEK